MKDYVASRSNHNQITNYLKKPTSPVLYPQSSNQNKRKTQIKQCSDSSTQTIFTEITFEEHQALKDKIQRIEIELNQGKQTIKQLQVTTEQLQNSLKAKTLECNKLQQTMNVIKSYPLFWESFMIGYDHLTELQKNMMSGILSRDKKYGEVLKGFWIDMFLNMCHRQFNKLAASLNGPWDTTVAKWLSHGAIECCFGVSWDAIIAFAEECYEQSINAAEQPSPYQEFSWEASTPTPIADAEPVTLMADETAVKIIAEFNPKDNRIYGYSAMPRFVVIRDVVDEFDAETFFTGLSIQKDSKTNESICGIVNVKGSSFNYKLGYAQFQSFLRPGRRNEHLDRCYKNPANINSDDVSDED